MYYIHTSYINAKQISDLNFSQISSMGPDQMWHLDSVLYGLLTWFNVMDESLYFGIYLYSGGCIHFLKRLRDEEYEIFCDQFEHSVYSVLQPGRLLNDTMLPDSTYSEKLATAWSLYASRRAFDAGFGTPWRRTYLEVKEFRYFVGSMANVHFGPRFPLLFREKAKQKVDPHLWSMRLHRYTADTSFRLPDSVLGKRKRFEDHNIEKHTEDLRMDEVLQAALSFMPHPGLEDSQLPEFL